MEFSDTLVDQETKTDNKSAQECWNFNSNVRLFWYEILVLAAKLFYFHDSTLRQEYIERKWDNKRGEKSIILWSCANLNTKQVCEDWYNVSGYCNLFQIYYFLWNKNKIEQNKIFIGYWKYPFLVILTQSDAKILTFQS